MLTGRHLPDPCPGRRRGPPAPHPERQGGARAAHDHDAPAEPRPGEPGAEDPGLIRSFLDQPVQGGRRDLEVVAERPWLSVIERAGLLEVASVPSVPRRTRGPARSRRPRGGPVGPSTGRRVGRSSSPSQRPERRARAAAAASHSARAGPRTGRRRASAVLRVDDRELGVVGIGTCVVSSVSKSMQQRPAGRRRIDTSGSIKPTGDADGVLGPLAQPGDPDGRRLGAEDQRHGDPERGAGGEPAPTGRFGAHLDPAARRTERPRGPARWASRAHRGSPAACRRSTDLDRLGSRSVAIERVRRRRAGRRTSTPIRWPSASPARVVVGVVADQVHPARRTGPPLRGAGRSPRRAWHTDRFDRSLPRPRPSTP